MFPEEIVKPLLDWFDVNARSLPWRENATAYRVWVSEIMLQQTRVEAVKPFYHRFMQALPDIRALSECPEEPLLKLWEGLGYYNRVRNMQIAAKTIVDDYDGEFPKDYHEIQKLKGIGSYTAGAIASIAFGIPAPAVDGNVLRVLSRILSSEKDIAKQSVKKEFEELVMKLIPADRPGTFNQALMELGAVVCVPNGEPHCTNCPLKEYCLAYREGKIDRIPVKSGKKERRIEERTVFIIRDGEKVLLHKRPAKGLLAGLYELPNELGHMQQEEALEYVKQKNLSPIRIQMAGNAKHIFSHVEWHMTGYLISVEELEDTGDYILVEPSDTKEKYPIPAAFGAYAKHLQIKLGQEKFEEEEH